MRHRWTVSAVVCGAVACGGHDFVYWGEDGEEPVGETASDPGEPSEVGESDEVETETGEEVLPPLEADAGPDQAGVLPGALVALEGRAGGGAEGSRSLRWTLKSRPANSVNAFVQNETAASAELYVDVPGDFIMEFSVSGGGRTARDTMRVVVVDGNLPPVANAGFDQSNVCIGEQVQLDGSASYDPDDDPITWHWEMQDRPAGSSAMLFGVSLPSAASRRYFIPDRAGLYRIELRVEDDKGLRSPPDLVSITTRDCSQQSTSSGGSMP